ncbi:hypothetical protein DL769_008427 [Monosporascus sp. CRB-8-3]|nr:hypothetical protein DL769_008427 [Monosporascus sp. CRB-8-3]
MKNTDGMTKAIDEKVLEYALLENVEGVSQEALFCLRRANEDVWGSWKDYDDYIAWLMRLEVKGYHDSKIEVEVFFAESDDSSGERGSRWFDALWKSQAGDWITYSSSTVRGTTHETIMRPEFGVLDTIFSKIADV